MNGHTLTDSATMLRRSLRRMRRYPSLTLFIAGIPVVLLLLFVYVFGGTLGAGLGGPGAPLMPGVPGTASMGRDAYIAYVVPGVLLITIAGAAQGTAISVAMDMTAGIIARFRTMAIARVSVLAGHVIGSVIQTLLATALVLVVALIIGFRPTTGPAAWLAACGLRVWPVGESCCRGARARLELRRTEATADVLTPAAVLGSGCAERPCGPAQGSRSTTVHAQHRDAAGLLSQGRSRRRVDRWPGA